jgi:hypothetical protein
MTATLCAPGVLKSYVTGQSACTRKQRVLYSGIALLAICMATADFVFFGTARFDIRHIEHRVAGRLHCRCGVARVLAGIETTVLLALTPTVRALIRQSASMYHSELKGPAGPSRSTRLDGVPDFHRRARWRQAHGHRRRVSDLGLGAAVSQRRGRVLSPKAVVRCSLASRTSTDGHDGRWRGPWPAPLELVSSFTLAPLAAHVKTGHLRDPDRLTVDLDRQRKSGHSKHSRPVPMLHRVDLRDQCQQDVCILGRYPRQKLHQVHIRQHARVVCDFPRQPHQATHGLCDFLRHPHF